jgi:hypothetical protein
MNKKNTNQGWHHGLRGKEEEQFKKLANTTNTLSILRCLLEIRYPEVAWTDSDVFGEHNHHPMIAMLNGMLDYAYTTRETYSLDDATHFQYMKPEIYLKMLDCVARKVYFDDTQEATVMRIELTTEEYQKLTSLDNYDGFVQEAKRIYYGRFSGMVPIEHFINRLFDDDYFIPYIPKEAA